MLSQDSIKEISSIFCGDTSGFYEYKTGGKLVSFFNQFFNFKDVYKAGFPSRWAYVYDKLIEFLERGQFDNFINIILSKEYIMKESKCSEVDALSKSQVVFTEINRLLKSDLYIITHKGEKYHLVEINADLEYIGCGGFANVYKQKSTGLIVKKLKDDYLTDTGLRSRFSREFNITKSLSDLDRIIKVYDFDESNCSYTMEKAEMTLNDYILNSSISELMKINCIRQVLLIMAQVHERDIIHRDISPNNIFIINGMIKIADFGLGKDLNVFTSHQTIHTNSVGQYFYCAPEQFMLLKDGDKRSDVYSLGRLINFIMTLDSSNSHHFLRSVAEKATNQNSAYRYADAGQLLNNAEKCITYHNTEINKENINKKIADNIFDNEIENYIYEMPAENLCKSLLSKQQGIISVLLSFMKIDDNHALHIIQSIEDNFKTVCGRTYEAYDIFAIFANSVLNGSFTYVVNELAANILRFVAKDVNRFDSQRFIEKLINRGLDPLIEEIFNT